MTHIHCLDHDGASALVAERVAAYICSHPGKLLCLAAGHTPLTALAHLVAMHKRGEVNLYDARYIALDEWLGLAPEIYGTCAQTMRDAFYTPAGIPNDRVHFFDGLAPCPATHAQEMLEYVKQCGGIGLSLLGVGVNGHIGFNEPGASSSFIGGVVPLSATTLEVGKKYFAEGIAVPTQGITLGIATLAHSEEIIILATGSNKRAVIGRALSQPPNDDLPISHFLDLPHTTLVTDAAAFSDR